MPKARSKKSKPRTPAVDEDDPDLLPREGHAEFPALPYCRSRAGAAERLPVLRANLRLVAPPAAARPSAAGDAGLRALGLLAFVRLDLSQFSRAPRSDLVAALIANYLPARHWSYVGGAGVHVSVDALADALSLPAPGRKRSFPYARPAVVASAATEFMKAYILTPLEASNKGKLPGYVDLAAQRVKNGMAHTVDWTLLIWRLVVAEMADLSNGIRTDWACHYGAYLQRIIWKKRPCGGGDGRPEQCITGASSIAATFPQAGTAQPLVTSRR
jgi:hypothetical protein